MASIYGQPVKRGDIVTLLRGEHDIWLTRTPEETEALRDEDRKAGRWHDDAGEPIVYGPYDRWPQDVLEVTVTVTSCRPEWKGHHRRPKGLREGYSTFLERKVLFLSV